MRRTDRGGAGYVALVGFTQKTKTSRTYLVFTHDGLDPEEIHGVEDAGGVKRPQR